MQQVGWRYLDRALLAHAHADEGLATLRVLEADLRRRLDTGRCQCAERGDEDDAAQHFVEFYEIAEAIPYQNCHAYKASVYIAQQSENVFAPCVPVA